MPGTMGYTVYKCVSMSVYTIAYDETRTGDASGLGLWPLPGDAGCRRLSPLHGYLRNCGTLV